MGLHRLDPGELTGAAGEGIMGSVDRTGQGGLRGAARLSGRVLRETLLTVAALGGAVCIVLVILAFAGGFSLIMFKTGSMSPTIPAGSVALVREIPASEVRVGDVLTVDRPEALPVTHRVTGVEPGFHPEERVITMRGDANEAEDPAPYSIDRGRVVLGSVPHLAHVIVWFGSPWVLGAIALGAAALVTWAFWPRGPGTAARAPRHAESSTARTSVLLLAGMLTAGAMSWASPGIAAADEPELLLLSSDLTAPGPHRLDTVTPLAWHISADASAAPSDGDLRVSLSGTGDESLGVVAGVRACDVPWQLGACAAGERVLRAPSPVPFDASWEELVRLATPASVHLRLELTAQPQTGEGDGLVQLVVRAVAADRTETTSFDGEGDLATTGASAPGLAFAPAAVLLGLGAAFLASRTRGRARQGEQEGAPAAAPGLAGAAADAPGAEVER